MRCSLVRTGREATFALGWLLVARVLGVESPVPPEAAHQTFQVDDGLQIELVAAEPLTASPVALAWDDAGRLFVVENRGYPTGRPDGSPGGVIALLEDTDGDGRMDRRKVFADGFTFPNGLLAWDGGFFVTCAPDVFFLKDTDGDDRADVRQVVLTGFDTSNSTQLRVAHPTFGPDGKVYLTSGLTRAGDITSPLHPDRPAVRIGTDSRFDPFTYEIEAIDGRGQFGQTFDDWGNRFHNMNRVHIQHTVLSSRFLKRNPDFAFTETVQNVPEGMIDDLLKSRNVAARIYPISDNLTTADSHAGTFSAACSVQVYRGDGLPEDYYGDVFTCDPTGNLVHRDRLTPVGPTFSSRMVHEGREFLASRDNWFRPVFLATGPDGALYIADMYRGTIEHPDYLPEEVRKRTDFEAGRERGRIWRVTSVGRGSSRAVETFASHGSAGASPYPVEQLVADLGHANVWQRERAMKLLLANRLTNALPVLQAALTNITFPLGRVEPGDTIRREIPDRHDPEAAAYANLLNTSFLLSNIAFERIRKAETAQAAVGPAHMREATRAWVRALRHPHPGVRSTGWRWLEAMFESAGPPDPPDPWLVIALTDPSLRIRFEASLIVGDWPGEKPTSAMVLMALADSDDKWSRAAFLSGLRGRESDVVDQLSQHSDLPPSPELAWELGHYLARRERAGILGGHDSTAKAYNRVATGSSWHLPALAGVIEGVGLSDFAQHQAAVLNSLGLDDETRAGLLTTARQEFASDRASVLEASSAITVLALATADGIQAGINLIKPGNAPEVLRHLLALTIELGQLDALEQLTSEPLWSSFSPTARSQVIDGLLQREATAGLLLRSLQAGRVPPATLSLNQRDRLQRQLPAGLKEEAARLFTSVGGDRRQVYEQFKEVAAIKGDASKGREVFQLHCASCHRLDRAGFNVGPDLFGIRSQPKEAILLHVLVPNAEVYPDFAAVTLETRDDRSLTGIVRAETADAITLVQAQGLVTTLRRDEITSRRTAQTSLMPDGFEQVMSRQELADLLAGLRGE